MAIISGQSRSPKPDPKTSSPSNPDQDETDAIQPQLPLRDRKPSASTKSTAKPASLLQPEAGRDEQGNPEDSLRPHKLCDYIGQKDLKELLNITIQAAKGRGEALDHLLLYGPPGLGKTTMALVLASEMDVQCKITSAPSLERPRDVVGLLVNLQERDILFIDEIHRLPRVTEEILYPAMEDYRLDITIGKGQGARTRSISLPRFTLVGATTRMGSLSSPLRDRFGLIQRLRFYEHDELTEIVLRAAVILKTQITPDGAAEIAKRARGTPRIANRLLKRVRDFVEVKGLGEVTQPAAADALELLNVDPCGLDWTDRRLLSLMIEQFKGRPVGLETLAAATGEESETIEEVYEPYLLQIGYLQRTPRGRIPTRAAWEHLGYAPVDSSQMSFKLD